MGSVGPQVGGEGDPAPLATVFGQHGQVGAVRSGAKRWPEIEVSGIAARHWRVTSSAVFSTRNRCPRVNWSWTDPSDQRALARALLRGPWAHGLAARFAPLGMTLEPMAGPCVIMLLQDADDLRFRQPCRLDRPSSQRAGLSSQRQEKSCGRSESLPAPVTRKNSCGKVAGETV